MLVVEDDCGKPVEPASQFANDLEACKETANLVIQDQQIDAFGLDHIAERVGTRDAVCEKPGCGKSRCQGGGSRRLLAEYDGAHLGRSILILEHLGVRKRLQGKWLPYFWVLLNEPSWTNSFADSQPDIF